MPAYSFFGHGMSVCGTCTSLKNFSPEESEYTRTLSPRRARLSARESVCTTPPLGLVEYVRSATSGDFIERLRFEPRYEVPHPVIYSDSHVAPRSRPHLDERLRRRGRIFGRTRDEAFDEAYRGAGPLAVPRVIYQAPAVYRGLPFRESVNRVPGFFEKSGGGLIFSVKGFSREAETHQQARKEIVARGREPRPEPEYRARLLRDSPDVSRKQPPHELFYVRPRYFGHAFPLRLEEHLHRPLELHVLEQRDEPLPAGEGIDDVTHNSQVKRYRIGAEAGIFPEQPLLLIYTRAGKVYADSAASDVEAPAVP